MWSIRTALNLVAASDRPVCIVDSGGRAVGHELTAHNGDGG